MLHKQKTDYYKYIVPTVFVLLGFAILGSLWLYQKKWANPVSAGGSRELAKKLFSVDEYQPPSIPPMPRGIKKNYIANNDHLVPVLMYHHIRTYTGTDKIEAGLSVTPENLDLQLKWLVENGYETITLRDLFDGKVSSKSVVLTFDDGYINNYQDAYMKLKANGQRATFFIISGYLGSPAYLSSDQLKEMSDSGMDIESHTVSHIDMGQAAKSDLENQLVNSKAKLEAITGKKVEFLCYPSGKFSDLSEQEVKASGYRGAVTTQPFAKSGNIYQIPRVRMFPTSTAASLQPAFDAYMSAAKSYRWDFK